ncbi:MAG: NAD(P)H-binding protein [Solirubrobacteraceae bacterium]|nr:NAD(P)H-binding protein [Solirubrobacteraceae bacterium]
MTAPRTLLTGATGTIGSSLLPRLLETGAVRCLVRDPARAQLPAAAEIVPGDVLADRGLDAALDGIEVAYYLVHSMGGDGDFAGRDRRAATAFAAAARRAQVRRVIYLGGLRASSDDGSAHLRSREEVGRILAGAAPEPVHARAAMVIGASSASFTMLTELVRRLPAMVGPKWIDTRSQPIAEADVTAALAALATHPAPPADVELGGADVLSYREMMRRFAVLDGRRPPVIVPVPVLTPRLSSYWVRFVTSVDAGLARPLVDGLSEELLVHTPPPPGINDAPLGFDDAVRSALAGARAVPSNAP